MSILRAFCGLALAVIIGCGGGGAPINGDDGPQYTLKLVVEKNLDEELDYLYVRFLRNGITISEGYVVVESDAHSDTIMANSLSSSFCLDPIAYPDTHWAHNQELRITATDKESGFTYRDSIVVPGAFEIDEFDPPNHLWQNGTVTVGWTGSTGVTAYLLSVTPSSPVSTARGHAERDATGVRALTFTPDAFLDRETNELLPDLYNVHIIGYTRNFVRRACAEYLSPEFEMDLDNPIDDVQVDGAISAIVVAVRDTIRVEPSL